MASKARGDYRKGNLNSKHNMKAKRGVAHHAFIQGPSTRSQRVERFWLDFQWLCSFRYRVIFESYEERRLLSVDNPFDDWCLHLCYLPMLNLSLENTVRDWNGHRMDDWVVGGRGRWSPDLKWWDSKFRASTKYGLMKGVLDAERRGINILEDGSMPPGREGDGAEGDSMQEPLGFAAYGMDGTIMSEEGIRGLRRTIRGL